MPIEWRMARLVHALGYTTLDAFHPNTSSSFPAPAPHLPFPCSCPCPVAFVLLVATSRSTSFVTEGQEAKSLLWAVGSP